MKKLQFAMVGGGNGALIGDIHRIGAQFDDLAELKAGCFSRHWDKNLEAGEKWGVEPGRIYPDYHTMLEEEAKRTGEDRLDFVVVATPNNTHYEIVKDIIAHGFHIVCDKPVTFTSRESEELKALAQEKDLLFGVSYSYAHYAILEQAKKMIADGVLGKIHTIAAEYPQEWVGLNTALRGKDGLTWRVDPAICGPSGVIADIGTHVEYLISKVTGLNNAVEIGACAFMGCTSLRELKLGAGLTSIGDWAFKGCLSLSTDVPASAAKIGEDAFAYTESVTYAGQAEETAPGALESDSQKIGSHPYFPVSGRTVRKEHQLKLTAFDLVWYLQYLHKQGLIADKLFEQYESGILKYTRGDDNEYILANMLTGFDDIYGSEEFPLNAQIEKFRDRLYFFSKELV